MSFKINDTVIYSGKEYIIVDHAASMSRESFHVIKIKDGSDNQEITVSEKELTKPSNNTTFYGALTGAPTGTPTKINRPNVVAPSSEPRPINKRNSPTPIQEILDAAVDPPLLTKEQCEAFETEEVAENGCQIADPRKCFTNYGVENPILRDALRSRDVMYDWREKEAMFGISGELSLFGLLEFALMTTNIIVETEELGSDEKKIISSSEGVVDGFIDSYNTYLNEDFSNRKSLNDPIVKVVTTYILKVLEEIKTNYKTYKRLYEEVSANFCAASYKLIVQIILTKSGLDPQQERGLTELVHNNNFCVFSTYDASAALNTPIGPVMTATIFPEVENQMRQTAYIIDDKCVMSILYIYKERLLENAYWWDRLGTDLSQYLNTMFTEVIFPKNFDNIDVGFGSDYSLDFIRIMNSYVTSVNGTATAYDVLSSIEFTPSIEKDSVNCDKKAYELVSKLVLNYNVSKGKLEPESITSESRDIRAHDYANSPIRYFGVYIYIIKRICDWLFNNKNITLDINSIEIDEDIQNYLNNNISGDDFENLMKYVIERETRQINDHFNRYKKIIDKNHEGTDGTKKRRTTRSDTGSAISSATIFGTVDTEELKNKYSQFLIGTDYIPNIFDSITNSKYKDYLKTIYYLMCTQTSDEFEKGQCSNLMNKTIVHSVTDGAYKNRDGAYENRVFLTCGPLLKDDSVHNETVRNTLLDIYNSPGTAKKEGIIIDAGYVLDPETLGVVDLSLKFYGPNNSPNSIVLISVYSEVDAAHIRVTSYTNQIYSHKDGKLYYNGILCAEVYSGYYKNKFVKENLFAGIDSKIAPFKTLLLKSEYGDEYKMTADTAPKLLEHLIVTIPKMMEYHPILSEEYKQNLSRMVDELIDDLSKIVIQDTTGVKKKYNEAMRFIIDKFIKNLSTYYDTTCGNNSQTYENCRNIRLKLDQIGNELYHLLYLDNVKIYAKQSSKGGGGNHSSCFGSSCISTEEFEPYSGPVFGQYITVENGIFVTKLIKSEDELKRLEEYYGYTKKEISDVDGEDFDDVDNRELETNDKGYETNSDEDDEEVESITDGSNEEDLGSSTDNIDKQVSFYDEEINNYNNVDKTPSNSSSRANSPRTVPKMGSRDGLNSLLKVGGKKTKKHKKPKNKKTTKKNVKRQTKHNKTTKRKKTTKRPAKRTRRRRYHSKH